MNGGGGRSGIVKSIIFTFSDLSLPLPSGALGKLNENEYIIAGLSGMLMWYQNNFVICSLGVKKI